MRRTLLPVLPAIALALMTAPLAQAAAPAAAATAAKTWTVTPGGAFAQGGARFAYVGPLHCDMPGLHHVKGTLKSGSGLSDHIGTIWLAEKHPLGCNVANGKATLLLTFTGLPWRIVAQTYDPKDNFVHGEVLGISATIASVSGSPSCTADLGGAGGKATGRAGFRYHNGATFRFLGTGDLRFENVTGCAGLLKDGTAAPFSTALGPPIAKGTTDTPEIITSP